MKTEANREEMLFFFSVDPQLILRCAVCGPRTPGTEEAEVTDPDLSHRETMKRRRTEKKCCLLLSYGEPRRNVVFFSVWRTEKKCCSSYQLITQLILPLLCVRIRNQLPPSLGSRCRRNPPFPLPLELIRSLRATRFPQPRNRTAPPSLKNRDWSTLVGRRSNWLVVSVEKRIGDGERPGCLLKMLLGRRSRLGNDYAATGNLASTHAGPADSGCGCRTRCQAESG